ncbi:DNA polymerase/3'-5' exonuclease PolX [Bacillus pseudomycoides]|uniref:DNA polymerase/3'-5' exonuclease PolX n=1 Tax=Bacillus pseudomycoides TaxID=64104 RepID=UPI000BEBA55C|nr:DNA polymerase/3'-5' exonuclease PolX [Bacillus pseudomycoides]PEB40509.1 DNA polymerase/3'-5' exonuclease PolX [Bacillus pseudomycoides]PGE02158.1 DNA polymerase/3'-5' exonuclease PolX [Bacillus pseudomycoides]PGE04466.1 DNA polymerase/3'-5' exonuclease PolX [Bacillus pseudomycoides]PHE66398.1 DNA polymerase/3'-5' exonuclease PolX [Bacillus pseudomycoides]PHG25423.1 DNA polymerase/3'-5' exonuclease PolX [Bacillus pseudomycoides]
MKVNKKQVIKLLETIGLFMELKGANPFKISAFRKAAAALESDDRSLSEIEGFTKIPGIGKGTAAVIQEYMEAGTSEVLQELEKEVPSSLLPLLKLPGLGGKKVAKLYKELGIIDMETLQRACEENKVQVLAGFGKKTEEKILEAIAQVGSRPERLPIAMVLPIAGEIEEKLSNIQEIVRFSRAGSLRRVRETVKDLDFIIATTEPAAVREHLLQFDNMIEVIASGDTKVSVRLQYEYDISIDFRLVKPEEFITTLHHFTGSKDHNVRMRQIAKDKGEKISEYGVENLETGEVKTFETEEAFFAHFGLPFIPPEVREDGKEVELIKEYPNLIQFSDIQGDLHMHTTWSDGAFSIEEMVQACRGRGYKFMAITDHSQYLKVANGLTKERLREQGKEIERINEKYPDITILRGIEMDILPDATLDFDDEVLAELDYVIGAIHSSFSQDRETIMKRLRTAIENKHVTMIAHPTGRLLGRREGYDVDTDLLIELAKETDTVLELNANPNRLDLSAKLLKQAQDAGVKVAINTDAHTLEMLEDMETGVAAARKGWIQKDTVINTWDIKRLLDFIKRNK